MFSKIENSEELNRPKENYTKTYRDKDREKYNKSQRDLIFDQVLGIKPERRPKEVFHIMNTIGG